MPALSTTSSPPLRLGFLASHRGSNMQAVIDACNSGALSAKPVLAISNNRQSPALERARLAGMEALVISGDNIDESERDLRICRALEAQEVDLVILAGYMKKIGPQTLKTFAGRIINIHPALLPKFGGKGMYGINVHRAVIESGERETGATVHWVDENYDTGKIIAQRQVPVLPDDTPESLAAKVLEVEHQLLVQSIGEIIKGGCEKKLEIAAP